MIKVNLITVYKVFKVLKGYWYFVFLKKYKFFFYKILPYSQSVSKMVLLFSFKEFSWFIVFWTISLTNLEFLGANATLRFSFAIESGRNPGSFDIA